MPSRKQQAPPAWLGSPDLRRRASSAAGAAGVQVAERPLSDMRTLIISDLHLGSVSNSDLLRRAELRAPLLEAIADVDRVVLLGDVLELRHGPMRNAIAAARSFFEDLSRALAARTGELVILAGNHDHALVEPWLARRGEEREPPPLDVEQLFEPAQASPALERIAGWLAPVRVRVAYPGLWVRPDVYATHGHYLDSHLTIPTLERLSLGAMARLLGKHPSTFRCVGDYEAVGAPTFAWRDAIARRRSHRGGPQRCHHAHRLGCPQGLRREGRISRAAAMAAQTRGRGGLSARGSRAEPRRDRPAARQHLDERAASSGTARNG